ncbi:MAG: hypothetical protein AABZ44_09730 [Elusimicrobiota bacterium]
MRKNGPLLRRIFFWGWIIFFTIRYYLSLAGGVFQDIAKTAWPF